MTTLQKMVIAGLMLASGVAFAAAKYEPGTYKVDPVHTKVGFEVGHLVISTVEGHFSKFDGQVELADKFENSKVEANVEIASIDTGIEKRDNHLRSGDFFDATKFPKMTFKSTGIQGKPNAFKLTGDLTIKGTTKKVTFDGKYLGVVDDGFGTLKAVFSAKTKISRKEFGLNWNNMVEAGPIVGDQVTINLNIEAGRPIAKKAATSN